MDEGFQHRHWPAGGTLLVEREATLPPDPQSPRSARQILREALTTSARDEWLDAGELAVTELVTNAFLHAHTPIDLVLAVFDQRLCVEVRDQNPVLPSTREYDDEASTGRGLGLVAAITSECGVHSLGPDGKIVWFCIGGGLEHDADALLDAWEPDEEVESDARTETNVELRAMPATLWLSARQHHDALLRELALYAAEHDVEVDFAAADKARSIIFETLMRALEEARRTGRARPSLPDGHPTPLPWVPLDLTLELCVAQEDRSAFLALPDALDLGERLAIAGELLVRPGLPEIIAVRDWACEQVVAQLAGAPPSPWGGTAQERFETEANVRTELEEADWDATIAHGSDRGVVAADDANRIVAISRPLAALLGWDPDELVGRRVVTIIPPALREAHVAGFSRHLTTGESNILGVPLELPVLHADGHEIPCRFLVQRAPSNPGRSVYLAWIEPVEPLVG